MIEVIVFSHRRQLQLHAYLESLLHFVSPSDIHVIYPKQNNYVDVWGNFQKHQSEACGIEFHTEHDGFDTTLRDVLDSVQARYLMFGCDDVIWTRKVDTATVCQAITPDVLGFSLISSDHINPPKHPEWRSPKERRWDWSIRTNPHIHLWGYPFELMGTVYRTSDVDDLVNGLDELAGPNDFEHQGCRLWKKYMVDRRPFMTRNENASCISQAVNVVALGQVSHLGTKNEHPDILEQKYQEGFRLDWREAQDAKHFEVWSGTNDYWKLKHVSD